MNEHTRNRVVGGVILVSLAAIFLPMLLDGEGLERREVPRMPAGELRSKPADEVIDPSTEDWAFVILAVLFAGLAGAANFVIG